MSLRLHDAQLNFIEPLGHTLGCLFFWLHSSILSPLCIIMQVVLSVGLGSRGKSVTCVVWVKCTSTVQILLLVKHVFAWRGRGVDPLYTKFWYLSVIQKKKQKKTSDFACLCFPLAAWFCLHYNSALIYFLASFPVCLLGDRCCFYCDMICLC